MTAEIIDFIDIWRAKRGLTRAQAFEQMAIARPDTQHDASTVVYVDELTPLLRQTTSSAAPRKS
jgi:hypothetical protein